jgi:imidazolonepropionase
LPTPVDLLIHSARQLVTCAGANGPKRGAAMRELGAITDGALAISGEEIVAVGPTQELRAVYSAREELDASGCAVCPGFVDPHTHAVYAGDRADEFEKQIQGVPYLEILAAGGGILSTVRAVRAAAMEKLVSESRPRLDEMLAHGSTTIEVKSGYGLDLQSELKMLQAFEALDAAHPVDLVPTFLGAHAVPPEYRERVDDYVTLVAQEMTPAAVDWYARSGFAKRDVPLFGDVFCEQNAFDVEQSRRVLQAALAHGMPLKLHADEFKAIGGVALALELGAVSVDHLDVTFADDIARIAASETLAVALPAVSFHLGGSRYADARALIDAGAALALATDNNPGSAPCPSMPLVMAISCRYQRLLPAEALNAGTINAAHAVGLGKRIGSLEARKQADALILDVPDIRHLVYAFGGNPVRHVVKRGKILSFDRAQRRFDS